MTAFADPDRSRTHAPSDVVPSSSASVRPPCVSQATTGCGRSTSSAIPLLAPAATVAAIAVPIAIVPASARTQRSRGSRNTSTASRIANAIEIVSAAASS